MNKKQKEIYGWLLAHPGYLKKGLNWLYLNNPICYDVKECEIALKQAKIDFKASSTKQIQKPLKSQEKGLKTHNYGQMIRHNFKYEQPSIKNTYGLNPDNVIFIPDLHAPFIKEGVLEFCKEQQIKYDCGTVIFAGDIVDGHAWSYHEHDVDGMSVGDELSAAVRQLKPWYETFPVAISLMGNHDLLIQRKARTAGMSSRFIRGFGEVIEAPKTWEFKLEHIKDNVLYKHGNIGSAFKVAQQSRMSTCQGHFHAETYVQWSVSEKDSIFGLQVGWGADRHAYAFDYGKPFAKKPIISCGIILDRGTTPIVKIMNL